MKCKKTVINDPHSGHSFARETGVRVSEAITQYLASVKETRTE